MGRAWPPTAQPVWPAPRVRAVEVQLLELAQQALDALADAL